MSRDYHRNAQGMARSHADESADQFDTTIMHNLVHETVDGQHDRDNMLIRTLDLAYRAYDISDEAETGHLDSAAFAAAEELNDVVEDLVDEQIAKACADVILDGDAWTDAWDEEEIDAAKHEAREWIQQHEDAAARADVPEEVYDA